MNDQEWRKEANPDEFWKLVDLARKDLDAFRAELSSMDRRAIIRFAWMYEELASALGSEPYVDHINPEFSEDELEDLWDEVVGRGRKFYESVLKHPEKMPDEVDYDDVSHEIRYEAGNVFHERFGEEIPPFAYDY